MHLIALAESVGHVCSRYRLDALRPFLEQFGEHRLEIRPCPRTWKQWAWALPSLRRADAIVLQRRLLHPAFVWAMRRLIKRLIFDFDDAVYLHDSYDPRGLHCPTRNRHFREIIRAADAVIAGNSYLAAEASRWTYPARVHVVPTCVDPSRYSLAEHGRNGRDVELVWIGSASTLQGVKRIAPILESLGRSVPGLRLKLICDQFFQLRDLPIVPCRWSEASEAEALAAADVGISWVPDDLWSHGKCGLKVLQCMAAGLPVIANPVGVQADLVRHGETGFLVQSEAEWVDAVGQLARNPDLRKRMGLAGRRRVEQEFGIEIGAVAWQDILAELHEKETTSPGVRLCEPLGYERR